MAAALAMGCAKDNYDAPGAILKGRVSYQNKAIGVRSNGVQLELWQSGFQTFVKIPVHIDQDGSFSASLFNGKYKLVRLKGNGPWIDNTDTISLEVSGNKEIDVPVVPYYTLSGESFTRSLNAITATVKVDSIAGARLVDFVALYIGTTAIVDVNTHAVKIEKRGAELANLSQPLNFTFPFPANLANRDQLFVRIGVKTAGVAELLYTPIHKLEKK